MNKKWLVVLLVVTMLTLVWGCGNSSSKKEQSSVLEGGAGEAATELEYWTFVELHGQHFEKMLGKWIQTGRLS